MCIQSSNNLGTVCGSGKAGIPTQKLSRIPPSAPENTQKSAWSFEVFYSTTVPSHCSIFQMGIDTLSP